MNDMFTEEQQKLERVHAVLNILKTAGFPTVQPDDSEYTQGYKAGVRAQHDIIVTMLEDTLL